MQRRRRPGGTATAAENWDFFDWRRYAALGFVRKRICAIEFIWHRYATLLYLAAYLRQYGFVRKRICAIEFIWHRYATLLYLAAYLRQYGEGVLTTAGGSISQTPHLRLL